MSKIDEAYFRPFRYAHRTWQDSVVAFREELNQTARLCEELGLEGRCRFDRLMEEELAVYQKEHRLFEAAQKLRHELSNLLNCESDGWVPVEEWRGGRER